MLLLLPFHLSTPMSRRCCCQALRPNRQLPLCRPHEAALLQDTYDALAALLRCGSRNIAVVNSATAAWQRVFLGMPLWRPGSAVITSVAEYGSNYLAYLQARHLCIRVCGLQIVQLLASFAADVSGNRVSWSVGASALSDARHVFDRLCCNHGANARRLQSHRVRSAVQVQKRFGTAIDVIDETPEGDIDLQHLERLLRARRQVQLSLQNQRQGGSTPDPSAPQQGGDAAQSSMKQSAARADGPVTLVSISHIPTSSGRVYDAEGVGSVVAKFPGVWARITMLQTAAACVDRHATVWTAEGRLRSAMWPGGWHWHFGR